MTINQNTDKPDVYELPDNSDQSVRRMWVALIGFFTALVLLVALVIWQAQSIAQAIPFSAEKRFVRPYETALSKMFGDSRKGSPRIERYLDELSQKLAASMNLDEDYDLTVHYLDIDEQNAFATLGGHVFILSGLLKSMPDENSLAMVLAHEIAHIQHRDPAASMSRGLALQMVYGFATGGGSTDVANVFGNLGESLYSRRQESSADIAALHALNELYGHVSGYRTFFEGVLKIYGEAENAADKRFEEWFSSHPRVTRRLETLDNEVKQLGAELGDTTPFPEYVQIRM